MFQFYTHWKHQKMFGFLVILEGIKWEHWPEISYMFFSRKALSHEESYGSIHFLRYK